MRFADILTTASAVANYLGAPEVTPAHMLHAIAILDGSESLEDLGRPASPLVTRGAGGGVDKTVRDIVQRWFERLGRDANAELDATAVESLRAELRSAVPDDG